MVSSTQKWNITFFSTFIFIIIISPYTYNITNMIFKPFGLSTQKSGCPTLFGLFLHTIVYMLITRYSMDLNIFE
jgi:hypothetical protein